MHTIRDYEIPTSINEMTVARFEAISVILKDESFSTVERYFEVLSFLGIPDLVMNDLSDEELFSAISAFSSQPKNNELIPAFELGGYTYRAYENDGKFIMKARDLAYIEKSAKRESAWLSYILAIIFKREDLGPNEHYADAHIKLKAKIFGELNAGDYYPYLLAVTARINKQIQDYVKDSAGNTEKSAE